jgi:hypothetical protein
MQDCIDGYRTCQILKAFEVRIEPQEYFEEYQSEAIEPEDYTLESNQVEDASIEKNYQSERLNNQPIKQR